MAHLFDSPAQSSTTKLDPIGLPRHSAKHTRIAYEYSSIRVYMIADRNWNGKIDDLAVVTGALCEPQFPCATRALILALLLLTRWCILDNFAADAAPPARNVPSRPVKVVAHRGANQQAPENTLAAFQAAIDLGADFIELDVRTTKDGHLVLSHDSKIDGKSNGKGAVRDLTLAELRLLDFGSWFSAKFAGERIPTFREALRLARGRIEIYLDHKEASPKQVLDELRAEQMVEHAVVYCHDKEFAAYRALEPNLRLMPPLDRKEDLDRLKPLTPYAVDADWSKLSAELIADCHQAGIKVFSDALGEHESASDYNQAIDWGLDAIQTDHLDRVFKTLADRKTRN
jgi:glycerophosphoryl diester phosphodiesterase